MANTNEPSRRIRIPLVLFTVLATSLLITRLRDREPEPTQQASEKTNPVEQTDQQRGDDESLLGKVRGLAGQTQPEEATAEAPEESIFDRLESTLKIAATKRRHDALRKLGRELAHAELEQDETVMKLLVEGRKDDRYVLTESIASALGSLGKDTALRASKWAEKLPRNERNTAYSTLATGYFSKDPNHSAQWVQSISDREARHIAIEIVGGQLDQPAYIDSGAQWAAELAKDPALSVEFPKMIAGLWSKAAAQETVQWARQVPEPTAQAMAFSTIAQTVAAIDRERAVALIQEFPIENGIRETAVRAAAYSMPGATSQEMSEWTEQAVGTIPTTSYPADQ